MKTVGFTELPFLFPPKVLFLLILKQARLSHNSVLLCAQIWVVGPLACVDTFEPRRYYYL